MKPCKFNLIYLEKEFEEILTLESVGG